MQAGFRYTPVHKTGRLLAIVYRGEINRGVSNYQVSHALLARASLYIGGVWIRLPPVVWLFFIELRLMAKKKKSRRHCKTCKKRTRNSSGICSACARTQVLEKEQHEEQEPGQTTNFLRKPVLAFRHMLANNPWRTFWIGIVCLGCLFPFVGWFVVFSLYLCKMLPGGEDYGHIYWGASFPILATVAYLWDWWKTGKPPVLPKTGHFSGPGPGGNY